LRLVVNQTDNGGIVYTTPISVNKQRLITIKRRIRIHRGSSILNAGQHIRDVNTGKITEWVYKYDNYNPHNGMPSGYLWEGFGFYYRDEENNPSLDLVDAIWDDWFLETITYDPTTGITTYQVNAGEVLTHQYNTLTSDQISFKFNPYGWFTGHYTEIDWITIEQ